MSFLLPEAVPKLDENGLHFWKRGEKRLGRAFSPPPPLAMGHTCKNKHSLRLSGVS